MLSEQDKIFINKNFKEGLADYVTIANLLHKKENLTGRSKEAKEIRDYMVDVGFIEKAKKKKRFSPVKEELSQNHRDFIDQNIEANLTPKQITELIFN